MLRLILSLNMSYFLTATEGIEVYSSLLKIERHLKYGHKSLKKPAKEVGSESWNIYPDKRTESLEMGGVNPEELDI